MPPAASPRLIPRSRSYSISVYSGSVKGDYKRKEKLTEQRGKSNSHSRALAAKAAQTRRTAPPIGAADSASRTKKRSRPRERRKPTSETGTTKQPAQQGGQAAEHGQQPGAERRQGRPDRKPAGEAEAPGRQSGEGQTQMPQRGWRALHGSQAQCGTRWQQKRD